jgi:hypothetical protein
MFVKYHRFFRPVDVNLLTPRALDTIPYDKTREVFASNDTCISMVQSILRPCTVLFLDIDEPLPDVNRPNREDIFVCRYQYFRQGDGPQGGDPCITRLKTHVDVPDFGKNEAPPALVDQSKAIPRSTSPTTDLRTEGTDDPLIYWSENSRPTNSIRADFRSQRLKSEKQEEQLLPNNNEVNNSLFLQYKLKLEYFSAYF